MQQTIIGLLAIAALANATPVPQGVTANISPPGAAPSGCSPSKTGTFGLSVAAPGAAPAGGSGSQQIPDGQVQQIDDGQVQGVSQIPDGQIQAAKISQIPDGQPQAGVSQIPDGQPQAGVSQIPDGQPQAGVSQIPDGQPQAGVSQIPDGQPQAGVSQIPDGQPQAGVSQIPDGQPQAGVSQIPDGQPQAGVSQIPDGQPQAPPQKRQAGAGGPLTLTLDNGVLKDQQGRTGYIASNRQFQFDGPPQTGAIYTSGWSVCDDGNIALGDQTTFYQCLSGDFYNLYDENWAPQCEPVNFRAV